jgi:nucleotide-binding universal stress UspA family protein
MSYGSVLVPITGVGQHQASLEAAINIARDHDATLYALHVKPDPHEAIPYIGEGLSANIIQELSQSAQKEGLKQAEEAKAWFRSVMLEKGDDLTKVIWEAKVGYFPEYLGKLSRVMDLTITPPPIGNENDESISFLIEVLLQAGKPVLMVPDKCDPLFTCKALVAWDGSAEAARAVSGAIPLLQRCSGVVGVTVGEPKGNRPGPDEFLRFLKNHGIEGKTEVLTSIKDTIAKTILEEAETRNASFVVMGAYSHNRWREMVLGGVTQYICKNASLPILFCH